ncbi:helix-turn-helix domain-containing protein [Macrococcoides caseolyticum]|uniref:helix-turn-helix domain-containing protein n=1 Tax=Macrococcoides caseolyticum TaxID=69966 RepID=UPI0018E14998|nr:helix-turn-helix transcriptional regulator [Macrococcus caseolyticus]QQB05685.1 helix-turn-helix transcriptional regulator [Macrococcus caseolyticus]
MKNNFRFLLADKFLKIGDVYEATRISRTTLTNLYYERTQSPDTQTIIKICNFLDVTPNDFFGIKVKEEVEK